MTREVPAHSPTIPTRRRGRAAVAAAVAVVLASLAGAPARADYGPGAEAASADGALLGDADSLRPSISDDGRYVAFGTSAVNLLGSPPEPDEAYGTGIVRRDMVTGAVELVAPPRRISRSTGAQLSAGATGVASISGNGRYVLFDTTLALVPTDLNTSSDVYVRDMSRPVTDVSAYELVSALDGTDDAPDYAGADPTAGSRGGRLGFAISDDGRRAVFRTEASSNLPSAADAAPLAPAGQVLVRLLDTHRTLLVTRDKSDPGMPGTPVTPAATPLPAPEPVLSGDGTAVAWIDTNAAAQTRMLRDEPPVAAVLWRVITAGPAAPTRRVAGTSDPDDPGCPPDAAYAPSAPTAVAPCLGPFVDGEVQPASNQNFYVDDVNISDDGRRVLFRTRAQQRPYDERKAGDVTYLADMTAGLTRKQGVRRILRGLGGQDVTEATLSGTGTRLAFTSFGNVFEGPRSIGAFPTDATTKNAFVVDLEQGIVQRVTAGADGSDFRGLVDDPSLPNGVKDPNVAGLALSDDATAIAFTAADGNLFVGDANGASDVQVVRGAPGVTIPRSAFAEPLTPPSTALGGERERPLSVPLPTHPVIGYLTVDDRGVARLTVRVPAAGRLVATASAPYRGRRLRVSRTSRKLKRAVTVHLRVAPTLAARKAARRARRLKVRIDVRYTPAAGRSTAAVRSYTLTRSAAR